MGAPHFRLCWRSHKGATKAAKDDKRVGAGRSPINRSPINKSYALTNRPLIRIIDTHYNDPNLRLCCERDERWLIATQKGPHPHIDDGVKVRQLFHRLRSQAIEPFNGLFKNI